MPIPQHQRALAFAFSLELDGFDDSTWKTVSGLEASLEVVDDPKVDKKGQWDMHQHPGQVSYADITLTRGFGKLDLFDWFKTVVIDGKAEDANRKNGAVTCYLPDRVTPIASWKFTGAWPSTLSSSDVQSKSSDLMIETMTLVIATLERTK